MELWDAQMKVAYFNIILQGFRLFTSLPLEV